MEPQIVEKGQILLVGLSFYGDPFRLSDGWTEENEIGRLWNRFMAVASACGDRIKHVKDQETAHEVHVYNEETVQKGIFEVFAGMEVEKLEDVPIELVAKILPPATYAVFTLKGQQITSDWYQDAEKWMRQAGYRATHEYMFQLYDRRFKGLDNLDESILDVYMPVERR